MLSQVQVFGAFWKPLLNLSTQFLMVHLEWLKDIDLGRVQTALFSLQITPAQLRGVSGAAKKILQTLHAEICTVLVYRR